MESSAGARKLKYHEEDENTAYRLQVIGAREGAIKGALVGVTLVSLAHWRFPWVRKQTLAGKAFISLWPAVFGMTVYADKYLLAWERHHRAASERWRSQARAELAASGTVPSETTMQAWKKAKDEEKRIAAQEREQLQQLDRQRAELLVEAASSPSSSASPQ